MLSCVPPAKPAGDRSFLSLVRLALASLGVLLLVATPVRAQGADPAPAQVPPAARLVRIGVLTDAFDRTDPTFPQFEGRFIAGLADLGYIEGQQYELVVRTYGGDTAALPGVAADLVAQHVDVIVAYPTVATLAAKPARRSRAGWSTAWSTPAATSPDWRTWHHSEHPGGWSCWPG
jgi:hypothetical protein